MTKIIILEEKINNNLSLKVILLIMYGKNNWLIRALQNLSLYKTSIYKLPSLSQP